jgi:hypothetical protein
MKKKSIKITKIFSEISVEGALTDILVHRGPLGEQKLTQGSKNEPRGAKMERRGAIGSKLGRNAQPMTLVGTAHTLLKENMSKKTKILPKIAYHPRSPKYGNDVDMPKPNGQKQKTVDGTRYCKEKNNNFVLGLNTGNAVL